MEELSGAGKPKQVKLREKNKEVVVTQRKEEPDGPVDISSFASLGEGMSSAGVRSKLKPSCRQISEAFGDVS